MNRCIRFLVRRSAPAGFKVMMTEGNDLKFRETSKGKAFREELVTCCLYGRRGCRDLASRWGWAGRKLLS